MANLGDLLSVGYFPRELPPPFRTESFGTYVVANQSALPGQFGDDRLIARLAAHNVARAGTLRRRLGIPNPIVHTRLCQVVESEWSVLSPYLRRSIFAVSHLIVLSPRSRAIGFPSVDRPTARASARATGRYLLRADIARFYPSIYTHSVPWALYGKVFAKGNRFTPNAGNLIDKWIRNGQDGQTMGIPIGPDTSLVTSELLLSAVDNELEVELPASNGFRDWDDYELCFSSRGDAEAGLAILQEVLARYELALNPQKTAILELPQGLEEAWASELRRFSIRGTPRGQATDLIGFFDRATILARENPGKSVLRYAISRTNSEPMHPINWPLLQDLLLQCLLSEPGTFSFVLEHFVRSKRAGSPIQYAKFRDAINRIIQFHAPQGHGSEVAWAIWAAMAFDLLIEESTADAISRMPDSCVALLALDARSRGQIPNGLDTTTWETYMTANELFGEQWLLSYEANVKGWLPSVGGGDHVLREPTFSPLKTAGVSFYDSQQPLAAARTVSYGS